MDLFEEFKNIILPYTDIPLVFIEAGAYSISSCCLGRYYIIPKSRNKRPNTYIIFASAPGVGRRGDLLHYIKKVMHSAFMKLGDKTNDFELYKDEIKAHLLEGGSPQGLADEIIRLRIKGLNSFCLSSTEFGRILSAIKGQVGYMGGFDNLLVKLWSGEPMYESFSSRGDNKPRYLESGTYFNICSTTQKIKYYLDNKMAQTGFTRRLLIAGINASDIKDYKPPLGFDTESMEKQLEELGYKIGDRMHMLQNKQQTIKKESRLIDLPIEQEAINEINRYAEPWAEKVKEDDENPYYLYQQTRWEYVLKISANRTLMEFRPEVTINDVKRAIPFVDNATKDIRQILEKTSIPPKMIDKENHMDKICNYFKKGLTIKQVQQYMCGYGVHKDLYKYYLKTLSGDGRIRNGEGGKVDVLW